MPRIVQAIRPPYSVVSDAAFAAGDIKPVIPVYSERVAQYIPAEVVAAYIALLNICAAVTGPKQAQLRVGLAVTAFVVGFAATIIYLRRFPAPPADLKRHIIISVIAFVVWAYAFPLGLFVEYNLYSPAVAGFALIIFSLASGAFKPNAQPAP